MFFPESKEISYGEDKKLTLGLSIGWLAALVLAGVPAMAYYFSLSGKAYLFLLGLSLGISLLVTAVIYGRFFRKSHRYGLCLGLWLLIGFLGLGTVAHLASLFGLI